jgi:hypothetical protein
MISKYNFQDLAKFIDDVKFLLARGGGGMQDLVASNFSGKSMPEIILRVIWLFLLWVFIIIIIYVCYKLLFKGYPRFPVDLLKFKIYNKVNVKQVVGDVNGTLFSNIFTLTDPVNEDALTYFNKRGFLFYNDECRSEDCKTIFQQVITVIDKEYGPEFNTNKVEEALGDYFKYYNAVTTKLGLRGDTPVNRNNRLNNLIDNVFNDYMRYYLSEIIMRENTLNCMFNDGKNDGKRNEIYNKRKQLEKEFEVLLKSINCKKVNTTCEFARLFIDPNINIACNGDSKNVVDKILNENGDYKNKKSRYATLEKEINGINRSLPVALPKRKKELKERKKNKETEKNQVKIDMIDIRNNALAAAEVQMRSIMPPLPIQNPTHKDIILYENEDRIYPSTKRDYAERERIQYTVYVPCFDLYKEYYTLHRDTMFKKFSKPDEQGMTEDEIVAFIFLTDVEKIMENKLVDAIEKNAKDDDEVPSRKPTLIGKFLSMYTALDKMSGIVRDTLINNNSPTIPVQYLVFPESDVLQGSIAELVKYKDNVIETYQKDDFTKTNVMNDYTYYLMEIFAYMNAVKQNNKDSVYSNYVSQLNSYQFNMKSLITVLNLPSIQQNDLTILTKFGISKKILMFVKRHPIFSLFHLNMRDVPNDFYHKVMQVLTDILEDQPAMMNDMYNIASLDLDKATSLVTFIEKSVFDIKKVIVSLHMINLYFSHYRDSVDEVDPMTKVKMSKDGIVDLFQQQNISYEFGSFFVRLFEPFKKEFLDGRIKASWRKAFYGPRFNPDLKKDKRNISYWRDFNLFWIDYMGKKMDEMMKSWWKNFKNYTKPRK